MPKINFKAVEKVPISFKFNHEKTQPRKHIDYSPKCMRKNLPCNFQLRKLIKEAFDDNDEETKSNPEIEEKKRQIPLIELFKKLKLSKDQPKQNPNSQSVIEPHIPTVNISKIASRKDLYPQLNDNRFENINKSPSILSNVKVHEAPAFERFVKRDENKYYLKNFYNKIEC